jgi:hypothetical protein
VKKHIEAWLFSDDEDKQIAEADKSKNTAN